MGEFNTVGMEDIIDAFSRREAATVEAVPKMLKAGADVLIEAQRAEAQAMGLNETGGFINSIKATDVKGDDTEKYVEIYPQGRAKHGNDRKGDKSKVRYATIGFVAEYGTSSHAARPYMTVANEKAHEKVVASGELAAADLLAKIESAENQRYIECGIAAVEEEKKAVTVYYCDEAAVGMKFVAGDVSGTVQGVTHIQADEAAAAGEAGNDRTALTLSKAVKAGCKVIALERTDTVAGMTTDDIAALKGVLKQYE